MSTTTSITVLVKEMPLGYIITCSGALTDEERVVLRDNGGYLGRACQILLHEEVEDALALP